MRDPFPPLLFFPWYENGPSELQNINWFNPLFLVHLARFFLTWIHPWHRVLLEDTLLDREIPPPLLLIESVLFDEVLIDGPCWLLKILFSFP